MALFKTKKERWQKAYQKSSDRKGIYKILERINFLRKPMIELLARKGILVAPDIDPLMLALEFSINIVGGKTGEKAREIKGYLTGFEGKVIVAGLAPLIVAALISVAGGIVQFFIALSQAKNEGKLSPDQAAIVEQAQEGLNAVQQGAGTVQVGNRLGFLPPALASNAGIIAAFTIAAIAFFGGKNS